MNVQSDFLVLALDQPSSNPASCIKDFRSCLMIDLGVTDGINELCLGVCFALRVARIEHCSGTVVTRFLLHSL